MTERGAAGQISSQVTSGQVTSGQVTSSQTASDYEQAIAAQPDLLLNYWHLGLLHLLAEDLEAAQSVWLSGLMQLDAEDSTSLTALVDLLQAAAAHQLVARPDLAELLYQQALEIAAPTARLWFCLGRAVALQGRLEAALDHWQQAIQLDGNWAAPHQQQGQVWQRLEAYAQAAAAYERAVQLAPDWQSYYRLGLCYGQLQQWQSALEAFEAALAIAPPNSIQLAAIQADLGYMLLRIGQLRPALGYLRAALQANPEFVAAQAQPNAAFLAACNLEYNPDSVDCFTSTLQQIAAQRPQPVSPASLAPPHPPPEGVYDRTESWAAADPGCYMLLEPASVVQLKPPAHLPDELHFSFRFGHAMTLPAAFVARIPQGRIWSAADQSSRAVFAGADLLADLSAEFPLLSPDSPKLSHSAQSSWLPAIEQISGRVAAFGSLSDDNYFHWMFEVLPQIDLLRRSGIDWQSIDYFQVRHGLPFQQQMLERLGIPAHKLLPNLPHIQARELIVASSGWPAWMPHWVCEFLRRLLLDASPPALSLAPGLLAPKRLYISRQSVRRVLNEAAVLTILQPLGFQVVRLEALSVQQQADLLAQAEVVIAPHGGGLTNLVFCQSGTKVIEIFPPDFVYPCYWLVANLVDLEYYYLLGQQPVGFYLDQLLYPNPRLADIWVDLNQLKTLLQLAGLG